MSNIGINVIETDGKATPSIQGAPTSVAAFIIRAEKGIPGRVEPVTNWTQFTENFGGHTANAYGAYAVRGFFDNGGAKAYVTRIVPTNGDNLAKPAKGTFQDKDKKDALTVKAGYRGSDNPGVWGNKLAVQVKKDSADSATYDLIVQYDGNPIETWQGLDNAGTAGNDPEKVINHDLEGSQYIKVTNGTTNPTGALVPLVDGTDGVFSDDSLAVAAKNALDLFDIYQAQLVCCPETHHETWADGALTYCTKRGDCMFIGQAPFGDLKQAKDYTAKLRSEKGYAAFYFPWIMVSDPKGKPIWIPPTGHVLGIYARTERERGVWKAPAGNAARVNGALDVYCQITDVEHTDLVKQSGINAVRFIPGQGIVLDSSRTSSSNPLWHYVNVRLLFNFVKSSLKAGLRWVVQEPHDATLWNKVKYNSVTPFLMGLWRRDAFGPGAPEEVFTVKCDAENNPPANIQQGIFAVEVYFYPSRPAETIIIQVGQQEGGGSAAEK